ncbi:MAG: class I SAM-dependent RNA methyltransferase, partial [Lachnospiraceae bacterium]|nr:class I SAM-dependent RNA methyltransferase [Lachnospiraceae bacterium]
MAPCHFGMESVLKKEIIDLGYDVTSVSDGRVTFEGDAEAVARVNICSRTAERLLIKAASFTARTFDELFEGVKAVRWEEFIPENGKFWVTKASSVKSALFSPSDIQSIVKKAMVESLKGVYRIEHFPEDGDSF